MHDHVVLQLLNPAAELDEPCTDGGIGDALEVAGSELIRRPSPAATARRWFFTKGA
jgi:hypothetical protein